MLAVFEGGYLLNVWLLMWCSGVGREDADVWMDCRGRGRGSGDDGRLSKAEDPLVLRQQKP